MTRQTVGEKIGRPLNPGQISFAVFFNDNFHGAGIVRQNAEFSNLESLDGFADAGDGFVFAEDGEDGREVGA